MPRKLQKVRPVQGARLVALRNTAGLSQTALADLLGVSQANIAFWERSEKPPRSDVLPKLAKILGVSVETILGIEAAPKKPGPVSRLQRLFDDIKDLPRKDQEAAAEWLEFFVDKRRNRKAG
jgi:transcriptional regulator with XRE-family HTH domain